MKFSDFWKSKPFELPRVEKGDKLSRDELTRARAIIREKSEAGWPAYRIKTYIQRELGIDEYRASRVFDTERKRDDVKAIRQLGTEVGFDKYRVILSPNACRKCRQKTADGARIFSKAEARKTGYGQFVPFHPNCYCIVVPVV